MLLHVQPRADLNRAVRHIGLHPASRDPIAALPQFINRLRAKGIATPRKTHGFRHADFGERLFDQFQFRAEFCAAFSSAKIRMRPAMVADLKAQPMKLGDFFPRQKIRGVIHPQLRDEKRRTKTMLFEQRRDNSEMRLHRIVKRQHNGLRRNLL
jgi:hypothetical protein